MPLVLSGSTGIAGVDGSASTPAVQGTDTNTGIAFPAADTVAIGTGGTERMRVDSSGNVGIGTTSPGRKVDIEQSGTDYQLRIGDASGNYYDIGRNTANGLLTFNGNQAAASGYVFSTVNGERLRIDTSGNVGIGTSSPAGYRVRIVGASGSAQFRAGTDSGSYLEMNGYDSGAFYCVVAGSSVTSAVFGTQTNIYTAFLTNNTERMRITAGGNILIGTTSDNSAKLQVVGNVYFDNLIYSPGVYNQTTGSAANMHIATDGNIFRSTSSRKYKRDIQDATFGLSDVLALRPVTYKGKSEADGETVFGGLIAEEVHDAGLTQFVQYAEDGTPDALAYGNMVALCIKAIQELKAENDDLKARLTALEAK